MQWRTGPLIGSAAQAFHTSVSISPFAADPGATNKPIRGRPSVHWPGNTFQTSGSTVWCMPFSTSSINAICGRWPSSSEKRPTSL
jgi:hypothetical protein